MTYTIIDLGCAFAAGLCLASAGYLIDTKPRWSLANMAAVALNIFSIWGLR